MNKLLSLSLFLVLTGCGAKANSVSVEIVTAPDGARCYIIKQGDEVRGGNCQ